MDEVLRDKIAEDFNQPEYVKVDLDEYQKLQEHLEYFKTTTRAIKEVLNSENTYLEKEELIKKYFEELESETGIEF